MWLKLRTILFLGISLLVAQGFVRAEDGKEAYQTTPPKYVQTTSGAETLDASVTEAPKLEGDASLTPPPSFHDFGDYKQWPELNLSTPLIEFGEKGVMSPELQLPPPAPQGPCPRVARLEAGEDAFDTYINNRIRFHNGHMVKESQDLRSKVKNLQAMPLISNISGRVEGFSLLIEDASGCFYQARQVDQTATLRLIESMNTAYWNPNQAFSFSLLECDWQWCTVEFTGALYNFPN